MLRRTILGALVAAVTTLSTSPAWAEWPEKTITFVIGFREGGGVDTMMRYVGNRLEEKLGVSVVMENRSGGGGTRYAESPRRRATRALRGRTCPASWPQAASMSSPRGVRVMQM